MKETEVIINHLKKARERITRGRKSVIGVLCAAKKPLDVREILLRLENRDMAMNRTTVYRELEFLAGKGIVRKLRLEETKLHYEIPFGHHHHLICMHCKSVQPVKFCSASTYQKKVWV